MLDYLKRIWIHITKISFADKIQSVLLIVLCFQLWENTKTNKVSIRAQLYQTEAMMSADESGDNESALSTIWAIVPYSIRQEKYGKALLELVTKEKTVLEARNAKELYYSMFGVPALTDESHQKTTLHLRRLFLFAQTNFYHVHSAFDYNRDGILSDGEWLTWKGLLREVNAHPIILAVIWQGYQNRYFSSDFARFLQTELCSETIPADVADSEAYKRNREFILYFYPEMAKQNWPDALPDY